MNKLFLFIAVALITLGTKASEQKIINLLPEKNGTLTYIAQVDGVQQRVESKFVLGLADDLLEKAKKLACHLKLRPDTVQASIGVISFSWETKRLCKK
ncbi:hypothetical protein N9O57_00905 [bacterium]|nr:hypothetical protein [bacterium]